MPQIIHHFTRSLLVVFLFFILAGASLSSLQAQIISQDLDLSDTTQMHLVYTKKGDRLVGRILSIENTNVAFLLNDRIELQFQLSELEEIQVLDGDNLEEDTNIETRRKSYQEKKRKIHGYENLIPYLVPTGFGLKKGETEVRNFNLFLFSIDHGIEDHLSIGADLLPFFSIIIPNARIKTNYSFNDNLHISGSANLTGIFLTSFDFEAIGLAYIAGALTIGTPKRFLNFSTGYGIPLVRNTEQLWVFSGGGSTRVGKSLKLTTTVFWTRIDEFTLPGIINGTFGWFNSNHRIDGGLAFFVENGFFLGPIPSISYAYRFGSGRR